MFLYQTINCLFLFSYNILLYFNRILTDSINEKEINAYKILSIIRVYTKEIYYKPDFLNKHFSKKSDSDSYFKISDISLLDSIDFPNELPVENISFELKRDSKIISITKLKEPIIIYNKYKKSIEIKIDYESKIELRDILEDLSSDERLTINIKINERIKEFPIFCFFNENYKFLISTDPYIILSDNPSLYLNYFTVDTFNFDLKNCFSFLSNCFKGIKSNHNEEFIFSNDNYFYEIRIDEISPLMFILNKEKIFNILLDINNDIYLDIKICREYHYFYNQKIPNIYFIIKHNINIYRSYIIINNVIGKNDTKECLIKSFYFFPMHRQIKQKDDIKTKDFLNIESINEEVIVNLKLKKYDKFKDLKPTDYEFFKVEIETQISESEKKRFSTTSSNISFEGDEWILISFKIKKDDQNEIYNILKSFNGVISIEIKTRKDVFLINYQILLDYNSYNILFADIIKKKYYDRDDSSNSE